MQNENSLEIINNGIAVRHFSTAMKSALDQAEALGKSGWMDRDKISAEYLSNRLRRAVDKGDPVHVANYAMMLHHRREDICPPVVVEASEYELAPLPIMRPPNVYGGYSHADMAEYGVICLKAQREQIKRQLRTDSRFTEKPANNPAAGDPVPPMHKLPRYINNDNGMQGAPQGYYVDYEDAKEWADAAINDIERLRKENAALKNQNEKLTAYFAVSKADYISKLPPSEIALSIQSQATSIACLYLDRLKTDYSGPCLADMIATFAIEKVAEFTPSKPLREQAR